MSTVSPVQEASRALAQEVVRDLRMGEGWFTECNESLNDANRRLIAAVREEHGHAWLGIVNRYRDHGRFGEPGAHPWIWEWDGQTVLNFSCCFVLPAYDATLERLLQARDEAMYTGTTADGARIDLIFARIAECGGHYLTWT